MARRQKDFVDGMLGVYFRTWHPSKDDLAMEKLQDCLPELAADPWDLSDNARHSRNWLLDHKLRRSKIDKLTKIFQESGMRGVEQAVFPNRFTFGAFSVVDENDGWD